MSTATKPKGATVPDVPTEVKALAQPELPAQVPTRTSPTVRPRAPSLARALADAQQKCKAAEKDAVNTYHRYRYASSEAIIIEAKAALADTGLALLPLEQTLNPQGDGWELVRKWLLLHESGESLPMLCHWPVCPEKGRPLDKAVAIAATLSLAYTLRDLLLMPRVDAEDEVAGRNDTKAQAPPPAPAAPQAAPSAPSTAAPVPAANGPPRPSLASPATTHQVARIKELAVQLGVAEEALAARLLQLHGVNTADKLTALQAGEIIHKMDQAAEARKAVPA